MVRPYHRTEFDPPFNGTPACPVCPSEVMALYTAGLNLVMSIKTDTASSPERTNKVHQFMVSLDAMLPLVQAHYDDEQHAFSKSTMRSRKRTRFTQGAMPW